MLASRWFIAFPSIQFPYLKKIEKTSKAVKNALNFTALEYYLSNVFTNFQLMKVPFHSYVDYT